MALPSPPTVPTPRPPRAELTRSSLLAGVADLARRDADLAGVVRRLGPPPLWRRRPGFSTLLRIILEQQVSLASAAAAYARLQEALGRVTAARVAACSERQLRGCGLTRQKAAYGRELAQRVAAGALDLRSLRAAEDGQVRRELLEVRGVGPWTADIYLLMALGRPDVWPGGDLALLLAARQVKRMRRGSGQDRLRRLAAGWRPWRSVAARLLWHHYLAEKRGRRRAVSRRRPSGASERP